MVRRRHRCGTTAVLVDEGARLALVLRLTCVPERLEPSPSCRLSAMPDTRDAR